MNHSNVEFWEKRKYQEECALKCPLKRYRISIYSSHFIYKSLKDMNHSNVEF